MSLSSIWAIAFGTVATRQSPSPFRSRPFGRVSTIAADVATLLAGIAFAFLVIFAFGAVA